MVQVTSRIAVITAHRRRLTGMTIHRLMVAIASEQVTLRERETTETTPDIRHDATAEQ